MRRELTKIRTRTKNPFAVDSATNLFAHDTYWKSMRGLIQAKKHTNANNVANILALSMAREHMKKSTRRRNLTNATYALKNSRQEYL